MNTESTRHFPDDLLERYAMGKLSDQESEPVEEHLLVCSACQQRLLEADEFLAATKIAMTILADRNQKPQIRVLVPKHPKSLTFSRVAWAVGLAAALVLFSVPLYRARPAAVTLASERGAAEFPRVHASNGVRLRIDVTQIPQADGYQLEVVEQNGDPVWHQAVESRNGQVVTTVEKPLAPGQYWVRLYDLGGPWTLLREYGLEVKK